MKYMDVLSALLLGGPQLINCRQSGDGDGQQTVIAEIQVIDCRDPGDGQQTVTAEIQVIDCRDPGDGLQRSR